MTTVTKNHPLFKLGKAKTKRDLRNICFASIAKLTENPPPEYDFDLDHRGIPTPMFGNDTYGDCVIAARAHQTLRFELIEKGSSLMITDKQVLAEYMKETGGADSGLVVLDSIKLWRSKGWKVARKTLKIQAFAQVNKQSTDEVRAAIYTKLGILIGLSLPLSAQAQVQSGEPWDVVNGPSAAPGSWGGHCVYVRGYTRQGPLCVTWGRPQPMTWAFWRAYCDEAYLTIDSKDAKGIDHTQLKAELARATSKR